MNPELTSYLSQLNVANWKLDISDWRRFWVSSHGDVIGESKYYLSVYIMHFDTLAEAQAVAVTLRLLNT